MLLRVSAGGRAVGASERYSRAPPFNRPRAPEWLCGESELCRSEVCASPTRGGGRGGSGGGRCPHSCRSNEQAREAGPTQVHCATENKVMQHTHPRGGAVEDGMRGDVRMQHSLAVTSTVVIAGNQPEQGLVVGLGRCNHRAGRAGCGHIPVCFAMGCSTSTSHFEKLYKKLRL